MNRVKQETKGRSQRKQISGERLSSGRLRLLHGHNHTDTRSLTRTHSLSCSSR